MTLVKIPAFLRKYILFIVIGNGLEWYDFVIFGYFAPIFSKQFFPTESLYASMIGTFSIFALGFISRPFGAYFFGKIGDLKGRKQALLLSMLLIAISTFLIGLLPTYDKIGLWAPCILMLLRILQGVSLGGECTSSLSFIIEHSPENRRGFVGSWIYSGGFLGSVLGATVAFLTTLLTTSEQIYKWGWRIPFILGFGIAFLGFFLRQKISETPVFLELQKTQDKTISPIEIVFKKNIKEFFQVCGIFLPNTVWIYLSIFIPTYMTNVMGWSFLEALSINLVPSILMIALVPIAGHLSDVCGRKRTIFTGQIILLVLAPLAFKIFSQGNFQHIMLLQVVISLFLSLSYGPTAALLADLFPAYIRSTGTAISYHVATGIFGGMTPLIFASLTSWLGLANGPLIWVLLSGMVGVLALLSLRLDERSALITTDIG
jgi:MFS transporter, MHS family, proline/betaine transporter